MKNTANYSAAAALQGLLARGGETYSNDDALWKAVRAYWYADAMIMESEKKTV